MLGVTTAERMLALLALDSSAHLAFSATTGKWYIDTRCEISNGHGLLTSVVEHGETSDDAVLATYEKLLLVQPPCYIVSAHFGQQRRCYRWNGGAFAEVTGMVGDGS